MGSCDKRVLFDTIDVSIYLCLVSSFRSPPVSTRRKRMQLVNFCTINYHTSEKFEKTVLIDHLCTDTYLSCSL